MKRVGIPIIFNGDVWFGGLNYFNSLISSLCEYDLKNNVEIFILTNRRDLLVSSSNKNIKIIDCPNLAKNSNWIRKLCKKFSTDVRIAYYAWKYRIDLLTHAMPGKNFMPKTLYWMPDFQHCHLPHLFSQADIDARNSHIKWVAERNGELILSSYAAEADFRRFYSEFDFVKTHVLQFVPYIQPQDFELQNKTDDNKCEEEPFFYIPNQFWAHKNHQVVIEALAQLPDEIKVICTGSLSDYRNSEHLEMLKNRIKELNLKNRFIILGVVERQQMMELMAKSVAVINPSLFEGWSTTVEEAKYMGKQIILSNLPVHMEQNPVDAIYFSPDNKEMLVEIMQSIWDSRVSVDGDDKIRMEKAKKQFLINKKKFAEDYIKIVNASIS